MAEPIKIYRPTVNEKTIKYHSENEGWKTVKYSSSGILTDPREGISILVNVAKGFSEFAFKDKDKNKGTILKNDAIKILQNVFKNDKGYMNSKGGYIVPSFLGQTKDLFELYMDKDSDSGENLTQKEQSKILDTLVHWFIE